MGSRRSEKGTDEEQGREMIRSRLSYRRTGEEQVMWDENGKGASKWRRLSGKRSKSRVIRRCAGE